MRILNPDTRHNRLRKSACSICPSSRLPLRYVFRQPIFVFSLGSLRPITFILHPLPSNLFGIGGDVLVPASPVAPVDVNNPNLVLHSARLSPFDFSFAPIQPALTFVITLRNPSCSSCAIAIDSKSCSSPHYEIVRCFVAKLVLHQRTFSSGKQAKPIITAAIAKKIKVSAIHPPDISLR